MLTILTISGDLTLIVGQLDFERGLFLSARKRSESSDEQSTKVFAWWTKYWMRVPRLFSIKRNRRAVAGACAVMFAQYVVDDEQA